VEIPDAEPTVAELRDRLDANAGLGIPAHVTVIYPFVPAGSVSQFRLDRVGWFGEDVVWLGPHDPRPFRVLTERVFAEFPDYPPFEGRFADVVPHLTVGHGHPVAELRAAEEAIRPHLPIEGTVTTVSLMTSGPAGRWRRTGRWTVGSKVSEYD
jgi:2'-5' RNA ligase